MTNPPSDRTALMRLLVGYRITQVLYAMVRLGIADRLAAGPKSAAELAREASVDPDRLFRAMRALAAHGVFAIESGGRFRLTPIGEPLRSEVPGSLANMIRFHGEEGYRAFGDLLDTIVTGETAFDRVFGMGHFDYLGLHPEASATFHRAMAESRSEAFPPLHGFDLRGHKVVVDVGGGVGALLAAVLLEHRHLRGVLFDLPSVADAARAYLRSKGVADRCELRTGSAFESCPPGGDVYVMARVLHDWPEEKALQILRNCRTVVPTGGVLLLKELIVPEGSLSVDALGRDLMMMGMNGGRERTENEWRALLDRAGFELTRAPVSPENPDLLEARPK